MVSLPSVLQFGQVKARLVSAGPDTPSDVGTTPDAVAQAGVVRFRPSVRVQFVADGPDPAIVMLQPVTAGLDADGVIRDGAGNTTVDLVATDSAGLSRTDWMWIAEFTLTDGSTVPAIAFALPAGTVVDLAAVGPVDVTPAGVAVTRGPAGLSAYDLAVDAGFVGTEADWLASLEGPAGPAGPSGPSGGVSSVNGSTGAVTVTAAGLGAVPDSRTVTAGTGLTGGGELSGDLSLAVTFGTTAGTAAEGNDGRLSNARPATDASVHDLVVDTGSTARAAIIDLVGTPWIDVDKQAGTSDTAKMQAAIDSAATAIGLGAKPVEVRLSGRNYTWTGAIPKIPCNLAGKIRINGAGSKVTLSSTAAAFLEINKGADYDVFRNVDIFDVDIDANNVAGYGHAIIGTFIYSTSALTQHTRVGVDNVSVRRVKVTNLPISWADTDFRAGVYLMAGLNGTSGESGVSVTNVVVEDVSITGGRFGIAIGARFVTSGNVYVDNCHINRCFHDTGATPTTFLGCTNFFLGARGYGGYGSVTNCHGKNSGDDGVEINGLENVLVDNCTIEDAANWGFLHNNFGTPARARSQHIRVRDTHVRVVNLASSSVAGMNGKGFVLNTATVASTTTADVASGATTIPLTATTLSSDVYFPMKTAQVAVNGQRVTYTGVSGNTLTGVTGVTATIPSGSTVTLINDVASAAFEGCSFFKRNQGYWQATGDGFKADGPVRNLSVRDFDYSVLDTAASIDAPATPAAFHIRATPSEPVGTAIRLDGIRLHLTGARTVGSTADWIGFDINGTAPFLTATGIDINNAMTGMSAVANVEGFRFGRLTTGVYQAIIHGFKIRALGDVGTYQKGVHTGTQTTMGDGCLFELAGLDFTGLLAGAQDVTSDSGSYVRTRTFVQSVLTKTAGRAASASITPTTGSFQWQNIQQRRGVVVVNGGTVSQIQVGATNSALVTTGQTAGTFFLNPGDYIQVVNTVVPTMTFIPFQ